MRALRTSVGFLNAPFFFFTPVVCSLLQPGPLLVVPAHSLIPLLQAIIALHGAGHVSNENTGSFLHIVPKYRTLCIASVRWALRSLVLNSGHSGAHVKSRRHTGTQVRKPSVWVPYTTRTADWIWALHSAMLSPGFPLQQGRTSPVLQLPTLQNRREAQMMKMSLPVRNQGGRHEDAEDWCLQNVY